MCVCVCVFKHIYTQMEQYSATKKNSATCSNMDGLRVSQVALVVKNLPAGAGKHKRWRV